MEQIVETISLVDKSLNFGKRASEPTFSEKYVIHLEKKKMDAIRSGFKRYLNWNLTEKRFSFSMRNPIMYLEN